MSSNAKIVYTVVDEAPALATYSLLPILKAFTKNSGIDFVRKDISLSGRVIANFPDNLTEDQKIHDYLTELGELTQSAEANIIKLPNISASIPQLQGAIKELQDKAYDIPDYPEEPQREEEVDLQKRFAKVLGSAVNPVLREGNSDRRAALSVKKFAQKNPHRMMQGWPAVSKARVACMSGGDFFENEKSAIVENPCDVQIVFEGTDGAQKILKEKVSLQKDEVIDTTFMSVKALRSFYAKQIELAKSEGLLLSLHLKATMMKISDPIMFGHAVTVYYKSVFEKYASVISELGVNVNNGLADLYNRIQKLPDDLRLEIENDIQAVYNDHPALAMVDSRIGKTNLHVPNDIIIDASMPNVVRDGGRMWNIEDKLQDTLAMIPDRSYATMYQIIIEDCQQQGQFNPATMGNVANVGLMAQKAEEYGSHDKTFEAPGNGLIKVIDDSGKVLLHQNVEEGDIFRMCQAKDAPIQDWIKLAVNRARATGSPAIFWLDSDRAHDAEIISKVNKYLPDHDTTGLDIRIMKPQDAMTFSLGRVRNGENTISVTGNVLRDYLTDLFPILELGTSAKMLSIVPLMKGGGLFETGAGGSAPKHVQQFLKEGHLRWDSLGEFCAIVPSLEQVAKNFANDKAAIYAETLDEAIGMFLEKGKSPSRKVNELDNRGSHYYLAMYWAVALSVQGKDVELQGKFKEIAQKLIDNESEIIKELNAAQGSAVDIGGYYKPDDNLAEKAMRPSSTLNAIIDSI